MRNENYWFLVSQFRLKIYQKIVSVLGHIIHVRALEQPANDVGIVFVRKDFCIGNVRGEQLLGPENRFWVTRCIFSYICGKGCTQLRLLIMIVRLPMPEEGYAFFLLWILVCLRGNVFRWYDFFPGSPRISQ